MFRLLLLGLIALAGPALAQDESFLFGGDVYASGGTVTVDRSDLDSVFAAGERIDVTVPIAGSAHLAGRRVTTEAEIGGNVLALGADVTLGGPVAGDVSAAGYDVAIDGPVGGNLRAMAQTLRVAGPVAGSALLSAGSLTLDAPVTGDAAIDAGTLAFGPAARIDGALSLYGDEAENLAVPASVAPPERITRHPGERATPAGTFVPAIAGEAGWIALATTFAIGVVILAVLAFVVAAVAPRSTERFAVRILDEPGRSVWIGFLTLSALLGACVVAVLTIIGVLAVPVIMLVTMVLCFLGYLVAVYVVGSGVWTRIDHLPPDTISERALAALIGALVVSLIGLLPFVGWPLLLLLTLAGLGAISIGLFRPEFRR